MSTILEIRSLNKTFGSLQVLKNVDLEVHEGEMVFLIGPSGSGKSTLLRCCNRLEDPTSGSLVVDGTDLLAAKVNLNKMRQRIGMVFQSFNLYPHMTAEQNVALALVHVQKKSKAEAQEIARRELTRMGLQARFDHYPSQLSGGQQQRVAIARALALGPRMMLMDEPTSALDPELVGEVLQAMRDLKAEGMTMLVVSHEMRFAREAADKIAFMEHGEVIEFGTPDELMSGHTGGRARGFMSQGQ